MSSSKSYVSSEWCVASNGGFRELASSAEFRKRMAGGRGLEPLIQWEDEEKEERVLFVLSYLKMNGFSIVKTFSKAFFTSDDENVGGEETNSSSLVDSRKYCCC